MPASDEEETRLRNDDNGINRASGFCISAFNTEMSTCSESTLSTTKVLETLHGNHQCSPTCSMKVSTVEFGEPNKVKMQINIVRETLWEATPDSVKEIPWKKVEKIPLEQLLLLGQKVLK